MTVDRKLITVTINQMELAHKNILVVGFGITGVATARFLVSKGASVTLTDTESEQKLFLKIPDRISLMREMGVKLELGEHKIETFKNTDLVVLSPGVPHTIMPVIAAKENGIKITGEVELASGFIDEPVIAVTGTNGKTTTTTLLGEMLINSGLKVFVGGNIGKPLIDYAAKKEKADIIVAELSSFQLDTIDTFRPEISVLLNITQDHLDRYSDFKAYAQAKERIFKNQRQNDTAVLNGSDPIVEKISGNIKAEKLFFYNQPAAALKIDNGAVVNSNNIIFYSNKTAYESLDLANINLSGKHNLENISAAALAALAAGGTFKGIQAALKKFKGLSHRLEYIDTIDNVRYFNDSKATNLDSVARALEAFKKPVILIMGGRSKNYDFHALKGQVRQHVKKLIIMGEATKDIRSALGHITSVKDVSSMEDAVFYASQKASPGDTVLLSPACSSFDMYRNYAHRGEAFCNAVKKLKKKN